MNAKSLRRLAADHASLHTSGLPPNYFWPPSDPTVSTDDLTSLDVLIAGPEGTPFSAGVWKLHLEIPTNYPAAPPTAAFKTRIWHPNVEEHTGAVCVDTLKRDWQSKLTLRDVLITISCLLIQPNPASALNGEAGALLQEDWEAFCRRARLMTTMYASVAKELREAVAEAKCRGEEKKIQEQAEKEKEKEREREVQEARSKSKGKARAQKPSMASLGAEEEENALTGRKDSVLRQSVESDDDADWIPPPDPFAPGMSNAFGIHAVADSFEPGANMEIDQHATPSISSFTKWSFGVLHPSTPSAHQVPPAPKPKSTGVSATPMQTSSVARTLWPNTSAPKNPVLQQASIHFSSFSTPLNTNKTASSESTPTSTSQQEEDAILWLSEQQFDWCITRSERPSEAAKRERLEQRRFKAAGFNLKRYNRGAFGPRKGLKRL